MVKLESNNQMEKGSQAPAFSLKNVDGSTVSLSDFEGKPVLVIFMCNHCPYVKPKMIEIGDVGIHHPDVAVVCINSNDPTDYPEDSFDNMKVIAEKHSYKYYLVDETQEVAKAYGATMTPDAFLFDKDHKLYYHGRINDEMEPGDPISENTIRDVIDYLIAGEQYDPWFQPSLGCSIKWKSS